MLAFFTTIACHRIAFKVNNKLIFLNVLLTYFIATTVVVFHFFLYNIEHNIIWQPGKKRHRKIEGKREKNHRRTYIIHMHVVRVYSSEQQEILSNWFFSLTSISYKVVRSTFICAAVAVYKRILQFRLNDYCIKRCGKCRNHSLRFHSRKSWMLTFTRDIANEPQSFRTLRAKYFTLTMTLVLRLEQWQLY